MDALGSYLASEMLKSLGEGNFHKFVGFVLIFALLWWQLRGLKKEFSKLNSTITKGFADGEARFDKIEKRELEFEHRLTLLENQ